MAIDGFDLAALLAPIPGDAPAGADLRQDFSAQSIYNRLRDARAEARAAERAMDTSAEEGSGPPPQWRTIRDIADKAITTQAKDLEIAAWYTEALLRAHGFAGLAAGFQLMQGLVEAFWDSLHPMPDEDGMLTKVAPVTGLNGEGGDGALTQPIRKVTLFTAPDGKPFALWQVEAANALSSLDDARRQARINAGALTEDALLKLAAAAPAAHWAALVAAIRDAQAAWGSLAAALDARAGVDAPPTSAVRDLLETTLAATIRLAGDKAPRPQDDASGEPAGEAEAQATDGAPARASGGRAGEIAGREDALKRLEELARWFRRTEPHSPLAYTLEDAVRRGRLSLPELLQETLSDETARTAFLTALGIRPPAPPE